MNKRLYYLFFIFMCFVSFGISVNANEKDGYISCTVAPDGLNLRDSVDGRITNFLTCGNDLKILDDDAGSSSICENWYKVKYNNVEYYGCGDYISVKEEIKIENEEEYREYLKSIGFPNSYLDSLVSLHASHPNWEFRVWEADIDFDDMVKVEYDGHSQGWSLIEDTGRYFDGYKSTDSWSYDYLNDVFNNSFTGGGKNWYAASKNTIAYYMDPRNFLNDSQIFMFETLSYNSSYHTKEGVETMLKGTFMESGYADSANSKTYADAFVDAAKKYDISPYVLVSRVIQEVGARGSTIVSGTVSGYEGYYNFYNIQAYGNSSSETIANGLAYAKSQGWDNQYKAIVGGASFLGNNYISQGQDTLYLQKWDLFGPKYGNHQYMQNIQAPSTESVKTYRGYRNIDLLDSKFVFSIPVFPEMPEKTSLGSSGNPNNYLSKLMVNDKYLFESATHEKTFNIEVDSDVTSVTISASKVNSKATISGTGSVSLTGEKLTIPITVIAENGSSRVYTINITRKIEEDKKDDELPEVDDPPKEEEKEEVVVKNISEVLKELSIKNDDTYFYGFELSTDISSIVKKIRNSNENIEVTSLDKNNRVKSSGIIVSGDVIKIKTSKEEKSYTIVIYGEVNGDGKISSADYIAIKNHIMDAKKLTNASLKYADANKDGKVNSADYIAIKNHIMDVKKITQ